MPEMEAHPVVASGGGAATPDDGGGFRNADDDKENLPPWRRGRSGRLKSGSSGRKRRSRRSSVLPSWYPRTPLRDITAIVKAIETRRARMRQLEGITREQNEEVASSVSSVAPPSPIPEHAAPSTLSSDVPKPSSILLTPEAKKLSLEDIDIHETASLSVTDYSKKPEAAAVKEDSTSLKEVTGSWILLGLETPDIVFDKATSALYTPDSVLGVQNSVGSVTTSDGTPVEDVVVEKWWLKKRAADTGNAGGRIGFGLEGGKKNTLLQNRSKVSLMR